MNFYQNCFDIIEIICFVEERDCVKLVKNKSRTIIGENKEDKRKKEWCCLSQEPRYLISDFQVFAPCLFYDGLI